MIPLGDSLLEGSIETVQQEGHDLMASVTAVEAVEPWQKLPTHREKSSAQTVAPRWT
jgi:hypothetical protein